MSNNNLNNENRSKTVRIYGCGGCGINLAADWYQRESEVGQLSFNVCFADTSYANIRKKNFDSDDCFILPGTDGSGGKRSENHPTIADNIGSLLTQFEPEDINVVIFSASGGSGSVFGPLIMRELLDRGETAIAIVVGSFESNNRANNTFNTIKSLDSIARSRNLPLAMIFENNEDNSVMADVDRSVRRKIDLLSRLCCAEHESMDSADIRNWLQYNQVIDEEAQLVTLEVFVGNDPMDQLDYPVSVNSLYRKDATIRSCGADYESLGYFIDGTAPEGVDVIHGVVEVNALSEIVELTNENLERLKKNRMRRPRTKSILADNDQTTDDDLIL